MQPITTNSQVNSRAVASQPPWINIDHQFSVNCLSPCIQAGTDGSDEVLEGRVVVVACRSEFSKKQQQLSNQHI